MSFRLIGAYALYLVLALATRVGPVGAANLPTPAPEEPPAAPGRLSPELMLETSPDQLDTSFEARCARLPPAKFDVTVAPLTFDCDEARSTAELTAIHGNTPGYRATALTTAVFGERATIDVHLVTDPNGERACGTPSVRVELSMQPVSVFVATELAEAACEREMALSHEMKHVAVFREVLEQAATDLETELPDVIGTTPFHAASPGQLRRQIHATVLAYLWGFMRSHQDALDQRQAEVDSPDEYARVCNACAHESGDR
jgi:hypothetical protein